MVVKPQPGYRIKPGTLKVNGVPVADDGTFVMPDGVVYLTAEFEPIPGANPGTGDDPGLRNAEIGLAGLALFAIAATGRRRRRDGDVR